jgi:antimicrobial peptide system SdpB family protein
VARSLLAATTACTLAVNPASVLFVQAAGMPSAPYCEQGRGIGLFCLAGPAHLDLARWIAVGALCIVATGFMPRVLAPLHWWVTWSFSSSAVMVDGGDQLASTLAFLLLPVALTDRRTWHWSRGDDLASTRPVAGMFACGAGLLIRLQVAWVYFEAMCGKFAVEEWSDGTALYYWLSHPTYGTPRWLRPLSGWFTAKPAVAALTWTVLAVELFLFIAVVMDRKYWAPALYAGIALHAGIMLCHGLVSFSLTMFAALVLYLRPSEAEFVFPHVVLSAVRRGGPARAPAL